MEFTEPQKELILKLIEEGKSAPEIGRFVGLSKGDKILQFARENDVIDKLLENGKKKKRVFGKRRGEI